MRIFEVGLDQRANVSNVGGNFLESKGQYTHLVATQVKSGGTGGASENKTVIAGAPPFAGTEGSAAAGAPSSSGLSFSTTVQSSIALPLPQNLTFNTSQDWSADELNLIELGIAGADSAFRSGSLDLSKAYEGLTDVLKNALLQATAIAGAKKALKERGLAHNPHREVFYNGPQFRTFQWSWEFAPIDAEDAQRLDDLIYALHLHSAPDVVGDTDHGSFVYPDTFEVEFVNTKLPILKDLALTDINVEYANSGAGPKFHVDDHPAFVSVQLSFIEMYPITRKDVREMFKRT